MTGPGELELLGRVAVAAGLGLVLGAERELQGKMAGMRTHGLVSLGAAAFSVGGFGVLSVGQGTGADVARIAAQVVTGIGFLGAGVIILHGGRVVGMTTAAELWTGAAVGLLCGLGLLLVASGTVAIALIVIVGGRPVSRYLDRVREEHHIVPEGDPLDEHG